MIKNAGSGWQLSFFFNPGSEKGQMFFLVRKDWINERFFGEQKKSFVYDITVKTLFWNISF